MSNDRLEWAIRQRDYIKAKMLEMFFVPMRDKLELQALEKENVELQQQAQQ